MPRIEDIDERRKEFGRNIRNVSNVTDPDAGIVLMTSDFDGIEHVDEAYINSKMLERVHRKIANDFVAGKTEWPERTTLSRKSFRGNAGAILNTVFYAPYIEEMHENNRERGYKEPTSFPERPASRYVSRVWADYAGQDIARTERIRGR